mmetsp:Transcript_47603/g.103615  ORF Transcript_47603/g.103615 Transcript_47603/m.103615 type:complete len:273 (+) Transcript_47603:380-1198(+)
MLFQNRDHHVNHVVRRMSSGRENSFPCRLLVDRTKIVIGGGAILPCSHSFHPDYGDFLEQDFGEGLVDTTSFLVPTSSLDEQSVHITSLLRRLEIILPHAGVNTRQRFRALHVVVPDDFVDWHFELTCHVLFDTGQERLREEETGNPKHNRWPFINPFSHELQSGEEISNIPTEGLQRGIRWGLPPQLRHLVVQESVPHLLKVGRHHSQALHSLLQLPTRIGNYFEQLVETQQLLGQYCVHGLVVIRRIFSCHGLNVERSRRKLFLNASCHF